MIQVKTEEWSKCFCESRDGSVKGMVANGSLWGDALAQKTVKIATSQFTSVAGAVIGIMVRKAEPPIENVLNGVTK